MDKEFQTKKLLQSWMRRKQIYNISGTRNFIYFKFILLKYVLSLTYPKFEKKKTLSPEL